MVICGNAIELAVLFPVTCFPCLQRPNVNADKVTCALIGE